MILKKYKTYILFVTIVIIMLLGVLVWNKIIDKKEEPKTNTNFLDVSDANNVPYVDAKLGEDVKITQGYLLTYATKKSGTWYMSTAYVKSIKKDGSNSILRLSANSYTDIYLEATIETSKCNVKKGDIIYFVGNINISEGNIQLSKISTEPIDYKSVTEITIDDLIENINLIKSTHFIVSGYMITDGNTFKLFDSKESYQKNSNAGNYFLITWKDEFKYTGNQNVKVKCLLDSTYSLIDCELQ